MHSSFSIKVILSSVLLLFSISLQAQVKFTYLGQYNALGVPDNLETTSDVIGQDFLNDISTALPEKKPVPDFHPEYIVQKNETDIVLKAGADLWITFVNEGAGFTNALGFYTYPASSPPKTTADIKTRTIVFPNVSAEGSGGGLKTGNKVYLGWFDANTAVGWFVVADAFKDGKMTQGKYILYSEAALNPEKTENLKPHTVLLKDANRAKLILGFEDVLRDQGSDQDFNDLTFYITASPYDAVKTEDVVAITNPATNPKDTMKPAKIEPAILVANPNTTNVTIDNKVNNTTGQNGTGGSTTNSTNTTNNVNTGTNTSTNTNSNNTTTNNTANTNTNSNNTTIINNTTVINKSGGGGNRNSGGNTNANTNVNTTNTTGTTNNTTVASGITVCNRDGIALPNFTTLKTTIKGQTVESNKPMVIKQAVKTKKVTVSQVKEMIKLISVEQYKLDMAKYLFDFTCDKSNYYELNALLNPSRARELDAFLKDKNMSDDNVTSVNNTTSATNNVNTTNYTSSSTLCDNGRMPYETFDDIKENINSKSFSDTKITVLKEAMPTRCISSVQVKELMGLFSFETDKLTVAKYLYKFTSDKQNYYKVNDGFSFSTSIEELKDYLKTAK